MNTLIFLWYLITGTIVYEKNIDGRNTYRMEFSDTTLITEGGMKEKTLYGEEKELDLGINVGSVINHTLLI